MMYDFPVVSSIFLHARLHAIALFHASAMSTCPKQVNIERFSLDFYRSPLASRVKVTAGGMGGREQTKTSIIYTSMTVECLHLCDVCSCSLLMLMFTFCLATDAYAPPYQMVLLFEQ